MTLAELIKAGINQVPFIRENNSGYEIFRLLKGENEKTNILWNNDELNGISISSKPKGYIGKTTEDLPWKNSLTFYGQYFYANVRKPDYVKKLINNFINNEDESDSRFFIGSYWMTYQRMKKFGYFPVISIEGKPDSIDEYPVYIINNISNQKLKIDMFEKLGEMVEKEDLEKSQSIEIGEDTIDQETFRKFRDAGFMK